MSSKSPVVRVVAIGAVFFVPAFLHLAALVQPWLPYERLSRDLFQVAAAPVYTAALSNLGVGLWCISAAAALLAGSVLGTRSVAGKALLGGGLLAAWLCLDDFLMLHEIVGRVFGVSTFLLIVAEGIAAAYWLQANRSWIRQMEWCLIAVAGAAWGVSLAIDFVSDTPALAGSLPYPWAMFAEDMPKLVGIAAWSTFVWLSAVRSLRARILPDQSGNLR